MFELRALLSKLDGFLPSRASCIVPIASIEALSPDPEGGGFHGSKYDAFSFRGVGSL